MSTYTLQYLTHKNTKPMQQQKSKTLIQIIYEIIKHQNIHTYTRHTTIKKSLPT
jgi:hypothetical protein